MHLNEIIDEKIESVLFRRSGLTLFFTICIRDM